MRLSYFSLPESQQTCLSGQMRHLQGSLQHLNPSLFTGTPTCAAVQILKMKAQGSVVFVLFYMVLVLKQGLQKGKKTIEKQEEKLKHRTSPAPL